MKDHYQRKLSKYKDKYINLLFKKQMAGEDSAVNTSDDKHDINKNQEKEDQLNETITTFMAVPPLS